MRAQARALGEAMAAALDKIVLEAMFGKEAQMTSVRDHHVKKYGAASPRETEAERVALQPLVLPPETPTEEALKSFYVEDQLNRGAFLMRNAIIAVVLFLIVGFAAWAQWVMR